MGVNIFIQKTCRPWLIVLLMNLLYFGQAQAGNYLLMVSQNSPLQQVREGDIPRLMGLMQTQLNNQEVKVAIRSEREVSDQFLQAHLKTSWFSYLDKVNKLFFQQRITSLPPILSLPEFLVNISLDSRLVTYVTEQEFKGLQLPPGVKAIPIVESKG